MQIAVFTVSTPDLTVETLPGRLREYGAEGIEWRVAARPISPPHPVPPRSQWYWINNHATLNLHQIQKEATWAKELCDQAGIAVACLSTYLTPDRLGEIEQVMTAAQDIDCPKIRIMAPAYHGEARYHQVFQMAQAQLGEAVKLAEKYHIKVITEIHHGTIIPSASAALRFVSPFPAEWVGVIYDPGNMVHEGFEQYQLGIDLLGEYLDHVHIKDAAPAYSEEQGKWITSWCPLGEGMVNFQELIHALRSAGYTGWLSIEDFSNHRDTECKLAYNLTYVRELLHR